MYIYLSIVSAEKTFALQKCLVGASNVALVGTKIDIYKGTTRIADPTYDDDVLSKEGDLLFCRISSLFVHCFTPSDRSG